MAMERTIVAEAPGLAAYLRRVWTYRRLVGVFALRDIRAQYAQTALGILWAAIKPLIALAIFSVFFGVLVPFQGRLAAPYPVFAFSGMVAWYYFTYLVTNAGTAVVNARQLIARVYFPKLILPLAKALAGLADFGISLVIMLVLMLAWGHAPGWAIVFFPVVVLVNLVVGLAVGVWLSALTTRFRDWHHLLPYLVNFLIWLTPVFYPTTIIPQQYSHFLYLNPMAGVIAGYRWTLLGDVAPSIHYLWGIVPAALLLVAGLWYFERVERNMVDEV